MAYKQIEIPYSDKVSSAPGMSGQTNSGPDNQFGLNKDNPSAASSLNENYNPQSVLISADPWGGLPSLMTRVSERMKAYYGDLTGGILEVGPEGFDNNRMINSR